jgi:hypothetical protein
MDHYLWCVGWDNDGDKMYVYRLNFPVPPGKTLEGLYGSSAQPDPSRNRFATEAEAKARLIELLRDQRDEIDEQIKELE